MPMFLTSVLRSLTPPVLWSGLRRLRPQPQPFVQFEHVPDGWDRPPGADGWDATAIAETYRAKWPVFATLVRAPRPLGVSHESGLEMVDDLAAHNAALTFAYVAARAARGGQLTMLDWGGGPGHYALLARSVLPDVEVTYTSKDVAALTALGVTWLPGDRFVTDDADLDVSYDLVVASGALHYAPDWREEVARLSARSGRMLYLTRLPIADGVSAFPYVQRVPAEYGYGDRTEFVGWCFGREELLAAVGEAGLVLQRELIVGEDWPMRGAPARPYVRGFLFERPGSA